MIHKNWQELIKPTQLVVKPGAEVRSTGAIRKPPSESFSEPGSACVAMLSVHPWVASTKR